MYTSAPQTIAPGSPVRLTTPSNAPYAWVVISNLSPYLLQITASQTGTSWLEPYTANLYPAGSTHGQFSLAAQTLAGTFPPAGAGAQVQATWYPEGEEPAGTWPLSLTAQAIASGLATAGLAGVTLLTVFQNVAGNGGIGNPATPSPFRVWSWGWSMPILSPTWPTSGGVTFEAVGIAGFSAIDNVGFQEGASDRLAGLWVPAPGTPSWVNWTTVTLACWMNYSTS